METGADNELPGHLAGLSIRRQLAVLAMWPLLEQVLAFAVATVDQALAGRFAQEAERLHALDALAITAYVAWLMMILQGAVATGGVALVSRATGARDGLLARRALGQAVLLGAGLGVVVCGLIQLLLPSLLSLFALEERTAAMAETYLRIVALSAPASGLVFAGNAALRGSGDTKTPFFIMTLVNVVNIIISWLLTFGPEPFGGRGIAGLAMGTLAGWAVGAVLLLVVLQSPRRSFRLELAFLRPHRETLRRILRVGLPSAVEIGGMWAINAWLLRVVAGLPQEGALGSHMIVIRAESLSFLPGFALATASATLAGQYLGLGDPRRAKQAAMTAWMSGLVLMSALGLVFLLFPGPIIGLIVPDSPLHDEMGSPLLRLAGLFQPFLATCIILKVTFRGTGDTRAVMRLSYLSMAVFRLGGATLAGTLLPNGLFWIWVCMSLDVMTQAVVFARRFLKGAWLKAKV